MTITNYLCYLMIPLAVVMLAVSALALYQYLKMLSISKDLEDVYEMLERKLERLNHRD